MTRWLVTGATGQLGTHLLARLATRAVGLTRGELDITDAAAVRELVTRECPDIVVNAAAYTAVDAAESDEPTAFAVNATAVDHLARAAERIGARFVHVSTDYVFDGIADRPYEPHDIPNPRTAYGRTKLAGEQHALDHGGHVVRTAWVYGGPSPNFVDTMLRLESTRPVVDVVNDQVGTPTYVGDLAAALVELGNSDVEPSLLHYANDGIASWFDVAREVFALVGADPDRVRPVDSSQVGRRAPRPAWSALSTVAWQTIGLNPPRGWRSALAEYVRSARGSRSAR